VGDIELPEMCEHGSVHDLERIGRREHQYRIIHVLPVSIAEVGQGFVAVARILILEIGIIAAGDTLAVGVAVLLVQAQVPDKEPGADAQRGRSGGYFPILPVVSLSEGREHGGIERRFGWAVEAFVIGYGAVFRAGIPYGGILAGR